MEENDQLLHVLMGRILDEGGILPFRQIQFLHFNQSRVQNLTLNLADRHACVLGHRHKGALDVGVDGGWQ